MILTQTFTNVSGDFSTSGTNTEPDASKRTSGYIANEGFPHENENFYMNIFTHNNTLWNTGLTSVESEINSVLSAASLAPNALLTNQLLAGIQYQIQNNSAITNITNTTDSTLYTNGALIVSGGVGIAKNVIINQNLTVTGIGEFVRGATVIVASSNSTQNSKNGADVVISTSSDSGTAINSLITTLNGSGGGTIELMEGTYNFTTNLLPLSNVNVIGQGIATILQRNSASLSQVINIANTVSNCSFQNFYINGNGTNYSVVAGAYGIYAQSVNSNINTNAAFELERTYGQATQNINEYTKSPFVGPSSVLNGGSTNQESNPNYVGILGNYFKFNPAIRALKRYEGDSIIESRFGSSIRFGSYDENRNNDSGIGEYSSQGGNPMILIRNRQSPIKGATELNKLVNKGFVTESMNNDGSSIHLTSGKTISKFIPNTTLPFIDIVLPIDTPKLDGDQIVFNSDRLVFSSKANEILMYSKGFFGITTDKSFSVSSIGNTTLTSTGVIVFNAPKIYLGFDVDGPNDEPAHWWR